MKKEENKYKYKPIGGWDDTVSWGTISLLIVFFFTNVLYSFK